MNIGDILSALTGAFGGGGSGGASGGQEAFHNGFVDMRPDTGEIRYLGGGAFDSPGYEMFGDLIPFNTKSTKINGIPTNVYRAQRAKYYGGTPQDYGAAPQAVFKGGTYDPSANYLNMFGGQ